MVNRRQVESRRGFPGGETGEMGVVGIQEAGNQDIGARMGGQVTSQDIKGSRKQGMFG